MTVPRMVGLLISLALVGLAVVLIRVEQTRVARHIQVLQFHETDLRREIWSQEMELARLRSPQMIRERAERMGIEAGYAASQTGPGTRR